MAATPSLNFVFRRPYCASGYITLSPSIAADLVYRGAILVPLGLFGFAWTTYVSRVSLGRTLPLHAESRREAALSPIWEDVGLPYMQQVISGQVTPGNSEYELTTCSSPRFTGSVRRLSVSCITNRLLIHAAPIIFSGVFGLGNIFVFSGRDQHYQLDTQPLISTRRFHLFGRDCTSEAPR